jgi:hypothetical protein
MPLEEGKQSTIDLQYVGRQRVCQMIGGPGVGTGDWNAGDNQRQQALFGQVTSDSPRLPSPQSPARVYGRWFIALATAAAPKPLSILTTETPLAQLFSIPSRAASPPKLAP